MIENKFIFEKDAISLYRSKDVTEIEKDVETIFKDNSKIFPKKKNSKILLKPNFNNDLNSMTGNSTDLRILVGVLKSLKKRGYKNITIADGPNCGINHIGIDVFSRLCITSIAKMFNVKLINLNFEPGKLVDLSTGKVEIAKICLESDFIINLPKLKTHVEAKITIACKNYIGCFKGTEKRKIHDNLPLNIVSIANIIKTDLIIVDGLIGMEGRGPGDGIPKKVGVIISGHDPFITDFLCSKLMGLDYKKLPYLNIAIEKGYLTSKDIEVLSKVERIAKFKKGNKTLLDRILLNNFFIGIRFSNTFEKFFNKGFLPWLLFKLRVKQDKYILEDMNIKNMKVKENLSKEEIQKIDNCLKAYCPIKLKTIGDKDCLMCMYCYQILPSLIEVDGDLGNIKMQNKRFGKYIRED
ncbi:MAG: DUF362 domain-containing protein [Nanoarchaeota archaeon]|nr:DUF362 domain-containing protein [Nanoarchaeota archaeon]